MEVDVPWSRWLVVLGGVGCGGQIAIGPGDCAEVTYEEVDPNPSPGGPSGLRWR